MLPTTVRPNTQPKRKATLFVLAFGVNSMRITAMIAVTLIATATAKGRISPITLPIRILSYRQS
jgi:hypothetical protein